MSRFLKVQCECGEEDIVFGDSKLAKKCRKCSRDLVTPMGGRAHIHARIVEVLS